MRICSISRRLGQGFKELGHDVLVLWPKGPAVVDLAAELERRNFAPDLIVQQEDLGPRVVLTGLERFRCPRIFWAVDSHLNLPWHIHYAHHFDGVMSPHLGVWEESGFKARPVDRLLPMGEKRDFVPHGRRRYEAGFVGRQSLQRMTRKWLAQFLESKYESFVADDISLEDMFRAYDDCRMVPNESIMMEVNFRLFEAASCGALVFSQNIGDDQNVAFTPGEEIQVYAHVLELKSLMDWHSRHPDRAEAMARRAWERVGREHLPIHRARRILSFAEGLESTVLEDEARETRHVLALYELDRRGLLPVEGERMMSMLEGLQHKPVPLAALIRRVFEQGSSREKLSIASRMMQILASNSFTANVELNLCCSMAALEVDHWEMAMGFLIRHKAGTRSPRSHKPRDPFELYIEWARELRRIGRMMQRGFPFDVEVHLPRSVLDCLRKAEHVRPGDLKPYRLAESWLSGRTDHDLFRLGNLSELWLREKTNWRLGLDMAMVDLRCFRLEQGVEELFLTWNQAVRAGEEKRFHQHLARLDPGGLAASVLRKLDREDGGT